jgi:hypothetical protein
MDIAYFVPREGLSVCMKKDGMVWFRGDSPCWPNIDCIAEMHSVEDVWWPIGYKLAVEFYRSLPQVLKSVSQPPEIGPCCITYEKAKIEIVSDVRIFGDRLVVIQATPNWMSYMWRTLKGLDGGYRHTEMMLKEGVLIGWPNDEKFLREQLVDFNAHYETAQKYIHSKLF